MRVGIAAITLESNTFNAAPVTADDFRANTLLCSEAVRSLRDAHHEVGGFLSGLGDERIEAVPLIAAFAEPGGILAATAYDEVLSLLERELDRAGRLDGLLLGPHGAMAAERISDADGDWMGRVRARFGPRVPVIATCDPHANVSARMIESTDALIAYRTNPHLDQRDRGREAARLIARTLRGEVRPVQAACFPPMAIGIERQRTDEPPCAELCDLAGRLRERPGVLSVSLVLGFPYADVPEMGSATIAVADGDRGLAERVAEEFGRRMWELRGGLIGRLIPPAEAAEEAARATGTVCLLDMGDNLGGGAPGDGTVLLHELRRRGVLPAFAVLYDPVSAAASMSAGVGRQVRLSAGGRTDDRLGPPLTGEFVVTALTDGRFTESEPRHGGRMSYDQGPTAVVEGGGLTLMLTSRRCSPFSLRQVTHAGLDPRAFRAIVAKGVHAPVAAYASVCDRLIRVDTPGPTAADMTRFPFRNRRRPMFPFEPDAAW